MAAARVAHFSHPAANSQRVGETDPSIAAPAFSIRR
jgi:hypothetical protein